MRKEWTKEEDQKLIDIVSDPKQTFKIHEVAKMMERSRASVKHRAARLGYKNVWKGNKVKYPAISFNDILKLVKEGISRHKIAELFNVPKHVIIQIVKDNGGISLLNAWTEEEDRWLRENYGNRSVNLLLGLPKRTISSIRKRAKRLGLKRQKGGGNKRVFNEQEVCQRYHELKTVREVAKSYKSCPAVIIKILNKHGISPQCGVPSKLEPLKETIIADYKKGDVPMVKLAVKYGLSDDAIRGQLKKWEVYDENHKKAFVNRRNFYQAWIEKYGEEEAQNMLEVYKEKKREQSSGKNNPMYGKPTPQGAGNGWKGWYKNQYFRSLREVTFMIELDNKGIKWESAEKIKIPYLMDGVERTYRPDYLVGTKIIEIKPTRLHKTPAIEAKAQAATLYCQERGLEYELIDIDIDVQAIQKALLQGLIRFDRDYESRFNLYLKNLTSLEMTEK